MCFQSQVAHAYQSTMKNLTLHYIYLSAMMSRHNVKFIESTYARCTQQKLTQVNKNLLKKTGIQREK